MKYAKGKGLLLINQKIGFDINEITKSLQAKYEGNSNEAGPSFSHGNNGRRKRVGEPSNEKGKYSSLQNNYKSYAKLGWNYISRYEPSFNGYFFPVMIMYTNI